ncbi:hypothetical protein [Haloprofundus halobius]|uniref:hypothetical protein n=1 Tax=Haloprofundus halobius TaxID=2876194 RepID=UPI001CCF13C4|nr:hypothetical protein [Haloprofundus halobius]
MDGLTHVALRVERLREAESYYSGLFGLSIAFREAEVGGEWRTLPPDANWEDAEAAGVDLGLSYLRRDGFELALERADAVTREGALSHIGVSVSATELSSLEGRLDEFDCTVLGSSDRSLVFGNAYGVTWEVVEGYDAASTGERTGRWIGL